MTEKHKSTQCESHEDHQGISRRRFLEKTGGATTVGASGLLLPKNLFGANSDRNRPVRIGIAGGRFGLNFQFHEHPGCTVTGVAELRPKRRERLSKVYRCDKTYDSLEIMLKEAKDIDAVAIFTEAPNHVPHCLAALKAGKHVLCAVPAAMNLDECHELVDTVKKTGLTYMMAETSYWQYHTISARKFYQDGKFGKLIFCDSMYQHDGLEALFFENGKRTWRHGFPPMHYPTHCTSHFIGVTGEHLTEVVCHGWGDDDEILKDNVYNNPFWDSTAMFKSESGLGFNVRVWWKGAFAGGERAEWIGEKMSFYAEHPNRRGPVIIRKGHQTEKDDAGFVRNLPTFENYQQPKWYMTDMLPKPLRHNSGHGGAHAFITHEFIDSLNKNRKPVVDVYEAVAYTAPGIVAHQSALKGGTLLKIPDFGRG